MHNNGIGGQTTSGVLARFQANVIGQGYARVIILCGTNDALQNTPDLVAEATANLKVMARMARDAGIEVVLSQLPPIVLNDGATSKIQALNGSIAQLAAENGYLLVDYFTPMQGHPEYFNTDGIHPNATGYAVMEKALAAVVRH